MKFCEQNSYFALYTFNLKQRLLFAQRRGRERDPAEAGFQRGLSAVQDGSWHQHLRAGLCCAQALRPRAHQHHRGVRALRGALLPQGRLLQTARARPLSPARLAALQLLR